MKEFIDIHSHYIPYVDDGSNNINESIVMLKDALKNNVSSIICTPHFGRKRNFLKNGDETLANFNLLKEEALKENIDIDLYLGNEIFLSSINEFSKVFNEYKLHTMNDSKYVLVEFSFDEKIDIIETLHRIKIEGYKPVIAHIERYKYLSFEEIIEIKEFGALIQINASSVTGAEGLHQMKLVRGLLKNGLVDFIASDTHYNRKNYMDKAYKTLSKRIDENYLDALFFSNAKKFFNIE